MPASLKLGQSVPYTLQELDAQNPPQVVNPPVAFDAPPVWGSSDPTVASVATADDGLSAVVTSVAVGNATITATGLIDGVTVTGSDDVTVADVVASLRLVAGTPGQALPGQAAPQK